MRAQSASLSFIHLYLTWALFVSVINTAFAQLRMDPPAPTPEGMRLRWTNTGSNAVYTVQTRSRLHGGVWLLPPAPEPWPIPHPSWIDPTPPLSNRFYRVLAMPAVQRGHLLQHQIRTNLSRLQITLLLALAGVNVVPFYDVQIYKFTYQTIGPWGEPFQASAALAIPTGAASWPLLSYQHGTLLRTNEAPSVSDISGELGIGILFASRGYVTILPDYLGLGESPGLHPYHHARSEATASLDAIRAARSLCRQRAVNLNGQLFLAGYSQGGHATMALHREIERFHLNEFDLTASAPMAGAYDLSGVTTEDFLSGRPQPSPYYFAYLLAAYQEVYRLTNRLADLLSPPYDILLPPLFHGHVAGSTLNALMPSNPLLILRPEVLNAFRTDPEHPLRLALRENDVHRWRPQRPMRLYHCSADQDVVFANAQVALASFHEQGATHVQLVEPIPGGTHATCVVPALLQVLQWFDSLKR